MNIANFNFFVAYQSVSCNIGVLTPVIFSTLDYYIITCFCTLMKVRGLIENSV